MRIGTCIVLALGLGGSGTAGAEVKSVAVTGFAIEQTLTLKAAPDQVYDALVDVGRWWDGAHSYSGKADHLRIEPRAGGCFCERLDAGGSVLHATVVFAARPQLLRMSGAFGPLQSMGVSGAASWEIGAAGTGSTLKFSYAVGGYAGGTSFEQLAPMVDGMFAGQMARLKSYVERGRPD
ncbi:SRPBCC family protein [Solimonas soli]|uniref:SRPBCC family protein n=1 Tax=Solimonas soli TaxID=413479 RepID=UPI0004820FEC|nr:SRPBCC domain-containing protein [Solimonas soli]